MIQAPASKPQSSKLELLFPGSLRFTSGVSLWKSAWPGLDFPPKGLRGARGVKVIQALALAGFGGFQA